MFHSYIVTESFTLIILVNLVAMQSGEKKATPLANSQMEFLSIINQSVIVTISDKW